MDFKINNKFNRRVRINQKLMPSVLPWIDFIVLVLDKPEVVTLSKYISATTLTIDDSTCVVVNNFLCERGQ